MIVINLFGAPNSGKTSAAYELSARLKRDHVEVEYFPESVKYAHYTQNMSLLNDELYLFSEKNHRLSALSSAGVHVAVTDGPLLNSLVYMPESYYEGFVDLVCSVHESYANVNIYINGLKRFSALGRSQTPTEAAEIGVNVKGMLESSGIAFLDVNDSENQDELIYQYVKKMIQEINANHVLKSNKVKKPLKI